MTSCGLYIAWTTHGQMKRMAALSHIFPTMTLWYSTSKDFVTVFARSDTAATIFFHHTILCGFYSRVAFIKISVISKILRNCALRKASCTYEIMKNCDAVTWFWSKPSSLISRRFATKWYLHSTSNQFPRFLPIISHDDRPSCLKKCQTSLNRVCSCTYRVYSFDIAIWDPRFVHVRMCYSNISCG